MLYVLALAHILLHLLLGPTSLRWSRACSRTLGCWHSGIPSSTFSTASFPILPSQGELSYISNYLLYIRNSSRNWPHRCSKMECWRPSVGPHMQRQTHSSRFTNRHIAWPGRWVSCAKGGKETKEERQRKAALPGTGCSHLFGTEWALTSGSWCWKFRSGPSKGLCCVWKVTKLMTLFLRTRQTKYTPLCPQARVYECTAVYWNFKMFYLPEN